MTLDANVYIRILKDEINKLTLENLELRAILVQKTLENKENIEEEKNEMSDEDAEKR